MSPLRYRSAGAPGSPPVMLVHGWMVSGQVWNALGMQLADCRLIVPDLRGCGESPGFAGPVTLQGYVEDLRALAADLDLRDCHLVGHSMGGQLAALLAAAEAERFRSLTLLAPVPVDGLPLPEDVQRLFRGAGGQRDSLARILDMACLALPPADRERLLDDAMRIAPAVVAEGFDAWMRGIPGCDLGGVRAKTVVVATDDPFLPPALLESAVLAGLPGATLQHLPGAGHYPQVEAPDATAERLRALWQ